jgi:hypothetical protein
MIRIEIGRRNYLLYLLLPHRLKARLLTPASRAKLEGINRAFNEALYSGVGASGYDRTHRYAEDEQHDTPRDPSSRRSGRRAATGAPSASTSPSIAGVRGGRTSGTGRCTTS